MAEKVKFGELLGNYRSQCGWSQEELAKKAGVSRNAIVLWEKTERGRETNTHPQSRGVVLRLADELLLSKEERKGFLEAAGFSIEHWPAEYWNVPYPRNPYFVGRETILQLLRQNLVPGAKTTALTQSISGLGGIGKTQVAVEYAHRFGEYYEAVLWIQADSLEVATAACLQLATEVLGLPEQQKAEEQIAEAKRWLQKRHGWLLIFDNVEDPQTILSTFVPSKHQGSVLLTTRRRDAESLAQSEVLSIFSRYEGVLFLLHRTGKLHRAGKMRSKAPLRAATREDIRLAKNLYTLLGGLPLALDQAGAYIAENGRSFQKYMDLYQQYRLQLLDLREATDHPDSVLITFWLSWEQIQERNALAGKALQFCAFLAPDQIPEQLVLDGITPLEIEATKDALAMDKALILLHRYSLIERTEQTLSLHRLVQEVMQDVLSEEERQHWMDKAVLGVNAVFPNGEYGTWPLGEILLPHALTCAKWIITLSRKQLEGVRLLNATGHYLYERAQYEEAEPLLQRALAIAEQQLGSEHPDTATSLNNLAILYQSQGRYEEAEPLYQRALSIREQQLGPEHPQTATSLNNLAGLYWAQGRYEEAEPLYKRALAIAEQQLGSEHPDTATSLNNLAGLYWAQERYEEAEPLYQRAVKISLASLDLEHPQTQQILRNYLTLLSYIYANGDLGALLQLLAREAQDDDIHRENTQE